MTDGELWYNWQICHINNGCVADVDRGETRKGQRARKMTKEPRKESGIAGATRSYGTETQQDTTITQRNSATQHKATTQQDRTTTDRRDGAMQQTIDDETQCHNKGSGTTRQEEESPAGATQSYGTKTRWDTTTTQSDDATRRDNNQQMRQHDATNDGRQDATTQRR